MGLGFPHFSWGGIRTGTPLVFRWVGPRPLRLRVVGDRDPDPTLGRRHKGVGSRRRQYRHHYYCYHDYCR